MRKNKSERCVDNRYESDSTRGVKRTSFVLIPIFSPIFFFSWCSFVGPLFFLNVGLLETHRGFAHLRLRFASVLSFYYFSMGFCSCNSFSVFLFLFASQLTDQVDDRVGSQVNFFRMNRLRCLLVQPTLICKMLRFNRQTIWAMGTFVIRCKDRYFPEDCASLLTVVCGSCLVYRLSSNNRLCSQLHIVRDSMTRGERLLNSADKKSTAQT